MNQTEARRLAEAHVPNDMVVLTEHSAECEFGFYFASDSRAHQETGRFEDLLMGSCGVLVDRANGNVHRLGSAFPPEYWFEAYRRQLHHPCTVVVTKVHDRQRAAESLLRLQMSVVVPEEAHGTVWRIPKHYGLKDFLRSFEKLPTRFENQKLIFRLHEIEKIEKGGDLFMQVEPTYPAEQSASPNGGPASQLGNSGVGGGPPSVSWIVSVKLKRIAKVACVLVCALVLLAVVGNGLADYEFVIVPKDWGFSVRKEIGTTYETNSPGKSFTNRVSHIGPIIFTQFNR
jgi:hypothetical protein